MTDYELDDRTLDWFARRYWVEDDLLRAARERFASIGPSIEVPAQTGALLATLVRASGARRVLEVGTLFGYSAAWMARALPEGGHVDTLELDDAHADAAQRLFDDAGIADRVTVHRGPALDALASLEGPYDLAFVDADKSGYPDYLDAIVPLLRPGGVLAFDNAALGGDVADPAADGPSVAAMRLLHERLVAHPDLHANALPIGDGVAVCVRR